jgi:hypothetical protein
MHPRKYDHREIAEDLIFWINHTKDTEGKNRLSEILRCFKALYALRSRRRSIAKSKKQNSMEAQKAEADFGSTISRTNGLLARYTLVPYVESIAYEFGTGWMPVAGTPLAKKTRAFHQNAALMSSIDMRRDHGIHNFDEIHALESLLVVVRAGKLDLIPECKQCGSLFFRERKDSKTCSRECFLESYKPRRKEKAKERYAQRLKNPNLKGG